MSKKTPPTPTTDQQSNQNQETTMTTNRVVPNWAYVLAAKFGGRTAEIKNALQKHILDFLEVNPEAVSFADEEAAKASDLGKMLARLPLSLKEGTKAPTMFRPLSEQVTYNADKAKKPTEDDQPKVNEAEAAKKAAAARADAEIAKARDNAAKKAAAEEENLKVLKSLGTPPKSEAEQKKAEITERLRGFALGYARVDQNSKPKALILGREVEVLFGSDFVARVAKATKGGEAKSFVAVCPWCEKKYTMNDQGMDSLPVYKDRKPVLDDRGRKTYAEQPVWLMQVEYLPCLTFDGNEYLYTNGDRKGQMHKLATLCCYSCSQIMRELWGEVIRDRVRSAKDKAKKEHQDEKAAGDAAYKAAKQDGPNSQPLVVIYGKWAAYNNDGGRNVFVGPEPDDRDPTAGQPEPTVPQPPKENPHAAARTRDKGERETPESKKVGTHGKTEDDGLHALAGNPLTHEENFVVKGATEGQPTLTHRPRLTAASRVASSADPVETDK